MSKTKKMIMEQIDKGRVKMKPRWWFRVRDYLFKSGLAVVTLAAAVTLTTTIYLIELLGVGELWEFGDIGKEIIRQQFPYLSLVGTVILAGISAVSWPMIGDNYKKDRVKVSLWLCVILMLSAMALTIIRKKYTGEF